MKRNDWKIILGSVLFTFLFYQQQAGLNYLIFSILIIILAALNKPENFLKPSVIISAIGTVLAGVCIYIYGTSLPVVSFAISLSMFTAFIFEPNSSLIIASFHGFLSILLAVPKGIGDFIAQKSSSNSKSIKFSKIALLFFPLFITLVFFFLYRIANPNFLEFTKALNFDWISLPLVRFFIFSIVFIYGLLSHQTIKYLERKDLQKTDAIKTRDEASHVQGFVGKSLSIENEIFLGASLLIMLNVLLAIVNGIDIVKLWPNQVLPENQESYSQYLHSGIQMLITSIVLAVGIIMFFFRGYFNYMKNSFWLKALAYLWLAQNVVLLVSSIIRNNMYVQDYGLSHKRIGVFIYLFLAIIGLIITVIKIAQKKNNMFLFRKNAWAFYIVLLLATPVRWDLIITDFNFSLAREQEKTPDINYLSELSHTNISKLLPYFKIEASTMYLSYGLTMDDDYMLNKKLVLFLNDMLNQDFQSQCISKQENYKAILASNEKEEITGIVLNQSNVNIEAIKVLSNIRGLVIQSYYDIEDWDNLKHFQKLEVLNLQSNYHNSLDSLPILPVLKNLNLDYNYLYNIERLADFTSLEYLSLKNNNVEDFSPLYRLQNLKEVYLDEMDVEDEQELRAQLPNTKFIFTENYNYSR